MKGYEVDLLSEDNLAALSPFPRVFARVSPDNKLKIIKALQKRGDSVKILWDVLMILGRYDWGRCE